MPRHDVAIYTPYAAGIYDKTRGWSGGAERQTVLLARQLQAGGLRTAHIVYPIDEVVDGPRPTLVVRPQQSGDHHRLALEPAVIWRSLARADASVYVFRTAHAAVGFGAAFCRAMRRRLIFSAANDSDFTLSVLGDFPTRARLYRAGAAASDAMVVQSAQQIDLARGTFPGLRRLVEIPSFVEPAPEAAVEPDAFLWATRLTDYKRPLEYLDLAAAVPEARFRMIAVVNPGDSTPALEAAVQRRAALLPNVEILPRLPHREVMDYVERAVAIVNTSETEGMPNVFLEGWARGVPALTLEFDPDGRIGRDGLGISAGGDFDAFAAGARELWARRADRAGFGSATRAYVDRTHGLEAVGGRWARLIRELM